MIFVKEGVVLYRGLLFIYKHYFQAQRGYGKQAYIHK